MFRRYSLFSCLNYINSQCHCLLLNYSKVNAEFCSPFVLSWMSDNVCLAISIRKAMISSQCSSWIFNHNGPRQKCLQVPYTHTQTQKRTQRDTHSLSNLWMDSLQSWAASRLGLCCVVVRSLTCSHRWGLYLILITWI